MIIIVGGALLLVMVVRAFWSRLRGLWEKAKQGGAILARATSCASSCPRSARGSPSSSSRSSSAAYSIPVTLHTVMTVAGGNSLANTVSATPGGVGINQAINTASLSDVTSPANAAAYSTAQQLIVTAFNVVFGLVLVVGLRLVGRQVLVEGSYAGAKEVAEQKAERGAQGGGAAQEDAEGGREARSRASPARKSEP